MTPADLYRTCRFTARRLETRQHYEVPGDQDRQRAFRAGEPLPPPGPGKQGDLELITGLRLAGRYIGRVHVVDRPLSDYVCYELTVYVENVAAGEDVLIADRSIYPELEGLTEDFVIFDAETVILFDYDDDGLVRGYRVTDDREAFDRCRAQYELAVARALSLVDFMAGRHQ
jgi:hypothetical protein